MQHQTTALRDTRQKVVRAFTRRMVEAESLLCSGWQIGGAGRDSARGIAREPMAAVRDLLSDVAGMTVERYGEVSDRSVRLRARGIHADAVAKPCAEDARQESQTADQLARHHAQYIEGNRRTEVLREELVAERSAIDGDRQMITASGVADRTTGRFLERMIAFEEGMPKTCSRCLKGVSLKCRNIAPFRIKDPMHGRRRMRFGRNGERTW